jgi:hypothetical protein
MHELRAALAGYLRWRRGLWPLERCAADAAAAITVLTVFMWISR